MTTEKKAPTTGDVERDFNTADIDASHVVACTCGHHGALARLRDLALLGVQVPGLVAERDDWRRKALDRDLQVVGLTSEVAALQARVAELRREWKRLDEAAITMSRTVDKVMEQRDEARSERDALRAQVESLASAGERLEQQHLASAKESEEPLRTTYRYAAGAAKVLSASARDVLSAPPAETTPCMESPITEAPLLCDHCSHIGSRAHTACDVSGCECFCGRIHVVSGDEAQALVANADTTPAPERAEEDCCPNCGEPQSEHRDYGTAALCSMR